ncbi:NADH dehydrogenase subunit K [Iris pallida]|uniref:NADH dehydrogenase subunit K (Plastid) n=1 Tax=Iris pallida TaxID=29817 RepID=A0AAX6G5W8_IRIPA|nr:NADH dehydrogenase subunit K [Iris pallida]
MPEPKYVIATGACTITGGMFSTDSYSTIRGVDKLIPVDVYLPGCPPKPEAVIDAITKLRKKISREILEDRTVSQQENRCFTTNQKFYARRSMESSKKRNDFFTCFFFTVFLHKNNSIKIQFSNLQERNVCYA